MIHLKFTVVVVLGSRTAPTVQWFRKTLRTPAVRIMLPAHDPAELRNSLFECRDCSTPNRKTILDMAISLPSARTGREFGAHLRPFCGLVEAQNGRFSDFNAVLNKDGASKDIDAACAVFDPDKLLWNPSPYHERLVAAG